MTISVIETADVCQFTGCWSFGIIAAAMGVTSDRNRRSPLWASPFTDLRSGIYQADSDNYVERTNNLGSALLLAGTKIKAHITIAFRSVRRTGRIILHDGLKRRSAGCLLGKNAM